MSISVYTQTIRPWYASASQTGYRTAGGFGDAAQLKAYPDPAQEQSRRTEKLRELLRGLKQNQNPYMPTAENRPYGFSELSGSSESKKEEVKKSANYNYKEVAAKILRAKTALSAGQAYISAKRKVLEIRRKISHEDGDPEELQLALTHAKRMEMAARKKKHHLELEELAATTQKRDEEKDQAEEAASELKWALVAEEEEKVTEQEDAVFEEREELMDEMTAELEESGEEVSDEMLADLNEMVSEFGEEELKALEEAMEMLENMEMVDPHMSEEELEELKRKHRAAEQKAILKADMDYLKDMIKHQVEQGSSIPGMGGSSGLGAGFSFAASDLQQAEIPAAAAVSVDIGI